VGDPLPETAAWRRLQWHVREVQDFHLRDLFAGDPGRGERLTADAAGLYLDFSKNLVTDDTLHLLRKLAVERGLEYQVHAMFRGEEVNVSEGRPALHVALRMLRSRSLVVDGVDVVKEVHAELDRMSGLAEQLRRGEWPGATGRPIRAVVNIGIGGSDLGPAMVYEALQPLADSALTFRFVSNVDPATLSRALVGLDPAETLFVVVSKSMSTLETTENAMAARVWLEASLGSKGVDRHFVGAAANVDAGAKIGIAPQRMLRFWDWVGGRTSLCSAAGFSLVVALGPDRFRALLSGFREMDEHFASVALGGNLPALSGLLSVWYRGFFGVETQAVFPYSHALRLLPAYLQQLWMESNGKSVTVLGEPVAGDTAAVLWGGEATNAQHAVFQLLHQGTVLVPADLIGFARAAEGTQAQHDLLAASMLAQAEALAFGRTEDELREAGAAEETIPHRVMTGNRPTSTILAERLDPPTLGSLIALYEHSVFTQAAVWGIDPFDQWGVELGKELTARLAPELAPGWRHELLHDSSTNGLVRRYRALRDGS
jgi:glucose-6-phosphate isomerase